jgi:ComF family protein
VIPLFKYHGRLFLAEGLENSLFEAFERFYSARQVHWIIPIPLHRTKVKKRGFNQSFLLVRHFSRIYEQRHGKKPGWQVDLSFLTRIRATRSQTGFDLHQRKENLKGAFKVRKGTDLSGCCILLVDDVYTTGATCGEAAQTLLAAGAARVDVLVLARA